MTDRKWLLDITIIRVARKCASLVEQEFGVRLPLAHSSFLERMQDYAARSSSYTLKRATDDLNTLIRNVEHGTYDPETDLDMIEYMGRQYPRWRDGKEFSGMYRGAPVYRETEPPSEH